MKFRVIPSILTDGTSQVKGEQFDNWRTVGSVEQALRVQSRRDVDEIVLLDVNATREERLVSPRLIREISLTLRVPLVVGGGIRSVLDVAQLLEAGADKIVLGTKANPKVISELAEKFGSQAIVCSVDASGEDGSAVAVESGRRIIEISPLGHARRLVNAGAGEILLQHVDKDGTMEGINATLIESVASDVAVPVLASSGLSSPQDAVRAAKAGAAGVVVGALLQFTQATPADIKGALASAGFDVRR